MKKYLHFDLVVGYFFLIALVLVCQSFTLKATGNSSKAHTEISSSAHLANTQLNITQANNLLQIHARKPALADSLEFEVKVTKHRKFLLSFYKKQASDIFIKIYDVLGNLVHQEKVSKKGKFKKEYDLSAYKTELYVIEVSDNTSAKAKRLFMG